MNPFKLWNFPGGLGLNGHKAMTAEPPRLAAIPERLVFPLLLRHGGNAEPKVRVGEPVLQGQVIARDPEEREPPLHASSSGIVAALENRPLPHPSGLEGLCLVIDTDGEGAAPEYVGANLFAPTIPHTLRGNAPEGEGTPDYQSLPPEELRRRIHEAGIVGLGGAGFPTARKLAPGRPIHTLILNGAECEPYITCDASLLRHAAAEVLAGADVLRTLLGAARCLVAVERGMDEALSALALALRSSGLASIELVAVPARYPAGGERQLIQTLTGLEVPSGGLPADLGLACVNVGTAAAVYAAVVHGQPLVSRIVTVTGQGVRHPQNLIARIGTPIADLVAECGGYTEAAERLILGGPMMGYALPHDDLPLIKTANCILVAGRGELGEQRPAAPCIRCGACAEACPAQLLPQQLYWHSRSGQVERALDERLLDCIECGCCDLVCPSGIPLVQHFRAAKGEAAAQRREREEADAARQRYEARMVRKEQERREQAEAALRKKASLGKSAAPAIREALERAKQKRLGKQDGAKDEAPPQD
jgi:electron transport complex protein RnfC